jgi:hypothetical protein
MSKLPVRDTSKAPFSPKTERILTLVQVLFPMVAAIATAIWAVNGYLGEQQKNREQQEVARIGRLSEARKPFYELQLKAYTNVAEVAGRLAAIEEKSKVSEEWMAARKRFYELYWSELSMVEDEIVKNQMVKIEPIVRNPETAPNNRFELTERVYCLAAILKLSIASNWEVDFTKGADKQIPSQEVKKLEFCSDPTSTSKRILSPNNQMKK